MRRSAWCSCVVLLYGVAITRAAGPQPDSAYDVTSRSFGACLDPAAPQAWPDKVRAIAKDEYHFWRGTRDLFYAWAITHCADWRDDAAARVVSQGDLHLGNLGSYAAAGPFGTLAYGLVDFDDSAPLPFQLELLQGVVTFDLIARENGIALTPVDRAGVTAALFDAYADALVRPLADTGPEATGIAAMLPPRGDRAYDVELRRFAEGDRFKASVTKKGVVTDRLRPLEAGVRAALPAGLAEAVRNDARLAALLLPADAAAFDACLLDAVERTRIDSSGSQGLSKILVLLRHPFRGRDGRALAGDGLLYLKQEVPAAAERVGFVAPRPGPPARRAVADLDALTHGRALAASWCDLVGRSYWVSVKEPWSDEPDAGAIRDVAGLTAAARVFGRFVGASHAAAPNDATPVDATPVAAAGDDSARRLAARLTPEVRAGVVERADAYEAEQTRAFAAFGRDPRVAAILAAPRAP